MHQTSEERLRDLAARAGLSSLSPRTAGAALAVLLLVSGLAVWRWMPRGADDGLVAPADAPISRAVDASGGAGVRRTNSVSSESSAGGVWIHIVGSVRHPGLYELNPGSRLQDAVKAAGGFLGNAAPAAVNLARKVADGEQLVIPTQDEAARAVAPRPASGAGSGATAGGGGASAGGPVDLNSATAEQLDVLPGIGPATATKIVADRETNGPFGSVEDLGRVSGIGAKKLDALKDLICVR